MKKSIYLVFILASQLVSAQNIAPYLKKHKGYVFVDPATMLALPKLSSLEPVSFANGFSFQYGVLRIIRRDDKGGEKFGFVNISGDTIVDPVYDQASEFDRDIALVKFKDKWIIIDRQGNPVKSAQLENVVPTGVDYSPYFTEGFGVVENRERKKGYIDRSGKIVVSPQFEEAQDFQEGLAPIKQNGKWGFIDQSGKIIIEAKYDDERYAVNGRMAVNKNGTWGCIDKTGKVVLPLEYESVIVDQNAFLVKKSNKWFYIDLSGKQIWPKGYDEVGDFTEGLAAVSNNNKWGFVDSSGTEIIPVRYDSISSAFYGVVFAKQNGKWSLIDKTGKSVGSLKFSSLSEEARMSDFNTDGPFGVNINGRYGFVDKTGKVIIPGIYEEVFSFHEGLAAVRLNKKYGYINKSGKLIVPAKYYSASNFENGFAAVSLTEDDGFPFYINKTGKEFREK